MVVSYSYDNVVEEICELRWEELDREDLVSTAWAYYFFSIQFRENLEIACTLHPDDDKLKDLLEEECDTHNLSPWPGVALPGEKMNYDEFMRRSLALCPIAPHKRDALIAVGQRYLDATRRMDRTTRAMSIGSYEVGGLEKTFRAFLRAPDWDNPLLAAFRHFLVCHIKFDSDPEHGHGTLSAHLAPDERIIPLWLEFKQLLADSVPGLATERHRVEPCLEMTEAV